MGRWESLIDQKIREAMEQGEFDDLAGKGEPIDLSTNPFDDADWRTAHRMLRNAGFAPAWIEERKDIDAEFETARTQLARARTLFHTAGGDASANAVTLWEKKLGQFREQMTELNRRITKWNLAVPTSGFQCRLINIDREIRTVLETSE